MKIALMTTVLVLMLAGCASQIFLDPPPAEQTEDASTKVESPSNPGPGESSIRGEVP